MQIDISPPTNVYATFGRLNYTPWHAIAEFVDNATQSYLVGREESGVEVFPELRVRIRHQGGSLVVSDNAAGMSAEALARALRLSSPPANTSGRSEFGMGLKTAACWFGKLWTVSTTRAGERWRYRVVFDVDAISEGGHQHIEMEREPAPEDEHGTTLTIERLARPVAGRQVEKTKKLLAGIYRHDLARHDVVISWNGEPLHYWPPELTQWEVDGVLRDCRIPIDLLIQDPHTELEHRVTGWAGSLLKMSEKAAGFALFRRGRMIIGGDDGGNWRVKDVVGSLNSHSGKRLVGELHMDDFPVNFTKDGFAWDGGLQDRLIDAMSDAVSKLRNFANNARVSKKRIEPEDFVRAVDEVQKGLNHPVYKDAVSGVAAHSPHEVLPFEVGDVTPVGRREVPQELKVPLGDQFLRARLELVDGGPQQSWLTVETDPDDHLVSFVRLNTGNRFVAQHLDNEVERTLVAKFALAVASAEAQARSVFGDDVPPDELREFLSLALDHSAT